MQIINRKMAVMLWSLSALLMAAIFYFSSLEDTELSEGFLSHIFSFFSDTCSAVPYLPLFIDKIFHAGIYAILGFLYYLSLQQSGVYKHLFLFSIILAFFYGVTDEFHQAFVPGRVASAGDLIADLLGAVLGSLAAGYAVSSRQGNV